MTEGTAAEAVEETRPPIRGERRQFVREICGYMERSDVPVGTVLLWSLHDLHGGQSELMLTSVDTGHAGQRLLERELARFVFGVSIPTSMMEILELVRRNLEGFYGGGWTVNSTPQFIPPEHSDHDGATP